MADTLRQSLESILDQLTSEFELIVVDGGSSDGSVEILRKMKKEYEQLDVLERDPDPRRHLGADRQRSFEIANGEYIIHHLDTDDVFENVIIDIINIYHQIEERTERQFALLAGGMNVAPRDLLLEIPYRNLGGAEDEDLWRRLYAEDALIWMEMDGIAEQVGHEKDTKATMHRWYEAQLADFQVGIPFWSYVVFLLRASAYQDIYSFDFSYKQLIFKLSILPITYAVANLFHESYYTPPEFRRRGDRHLHTYRTRMSLDELEKKYGFRINRDDLSPATKRLL